jgi:hypothetical protein
VSAAFDPADWLSRYTAAGGWYAMRGDALVFGWPVPGPWAPTATREVYREIEHHPDRRAELLAHVKARCLIA